MGKLLIDVLNLENSGLVGFSEIGEEIKLKEKISDMDIGSVAPSRVEKRIQQILKETDNNTYVHFEIGRIAHDSLHYRLYKIRE